MQIELNDDGIQKTFFLHKLPATKLFAFTNNLLGLISQSDFLNQDAFKKVIFSRMNTGIEIEADEDAVKELGAMQLPEVLFNAVKSILANFNDYRQMELLTPLISCIVYQNGAVTLRFNLIEGSPEHIDNHVTSVKVLYQLCWELLKLNYSFLAGSPEKNTV